MGENFWQSSRRRVQQAGDWSPSFLKDPSAGQISGDGIFVLMYQGSPVKALADRSEFLVGGCKVTQVPGPVKLQWTETQLLPGQSPRLEKRMIRRMVSHGMHVTIVSLQVKVFDSTNLSGDMDRWGRQCRAALAMVAVKLDDRVCEKYLGENLWLKDSSGRSAIVDSAKLVRSFDPGVESKHATDVATETLSTWAYDESDAHSRSLRWYLSAIELGPTSAGFILLATACEALIVAPKGKNKSFNRAMIEGQLNLVGATFTADQVARVVRVRAAIVHDGFEDHELLVESYYLLEEMTRTLLLAASPDPRGAAWPREVQTNTGGGRYRIIEEFEW